MTIRNRAGLVAVLSSVLLLMTAIGVAGMIGSLRDIQSQERLVTQTMDAVHAMRELAGEFTGNSQARVSDQWSTLERQALAHLDQLSMIGTLSTGMKAELIGRFSQMSRIFERLREQAWQDETRFIRLSFLNTRIISEAESVISRLQEIRFALEQKTNTVSLLTFSFIVVFVFGGFIINLLFFVFVRNHILHPLDTLRGDAKRIGGGDFIAPVSTSRPDEIGDLYRAIEAMRRDLLQLTNKLTQKIEEAERANIAKTNFLANMSHELRTPLNAIIGYADLIEHNHGTVSNVERHQQFAGYIRRSGEQLARIVSDLLDLSRIEAGHISLAYMPFDLAELLDEVCSAFTDRAWKTRTNLKFESDIGVDLINSDATRIRQILFNLIDNALKFAEGGCVTVTIKTVTVLRGRANLLIEVSDDGIGIAADNIQRIFRPFSQEDESITRKFGGTGLGLAIVRQIAEAMGGHLDVESTLGAGSTFKLRMPVETLHKAQLDKAYELTEENNEKSASDQNKLQVLIVDDIESNVSIAEDILSSLGCRTVCAISGAEAIAASQSRDFDLILLDVHMPDLDGRRVAKRIRNAQARRARQSIIYGWTADAILGDEYYLTQFGFDGVILKPCQVQDFVHVLQQISPDSISLSS